MTSKLTYEQIMARRERIWALELRLRSALADPFGAAIARRGIHWGQLRFELSLPDPYLDVSEAQVARALNRGDDGPVSLRTIVMLADALDLDVSISVSPREREAVTS